MGETATENTLARVPFYSLFHRQGSILLSSHIARGLSSYLLLYFCPSISIICVQIFFGHHSSPGPKSGPKSDWGFFLFMVFGFLCPPQQCGFFLFKNFLFRRVWINLIEIFIST